MIRNPTHRSRCSSLLTSAMLALVFAPGKLGVASDLSYPAESYVTGVGPRFVEVADFNIDGVPDLAVVNELSHSVSILPGNGKGTFQRRNDVSVGLLPLDLAVGDFNADNVPDIAVTRSLANASGTIAVLLGQGDGTFSDGQGLVPNILTRSIAAGDVDGDNQTDLVFRNSLSGDLMMLVGNGDGTFQPPRIIAPAIQALDIAIHDFNGDGTPDLAVGGTLVVRILLGQGAGTFQTAGVFATTVLPTQIAVGDVDGDGNSDIALSPTEAISAPRAINVLLGNGDGTFPRLVDLPLASQPDSVAICDYNADGRTDLAVALGSASIALLTGNGDGTFAPGATLATTNQPRSVVCADFDGDGNTDLVTAGQTSSSVCVHLGNGDGAFATRRDVRLFGFGRLASIAVADLDSNGTLDITTAGSSQNSGVGVLLGRGDGTFQAVTRFDVGAQPTSVAIGDLNNDRVPDLTVANSFIGSGGSAVSTLLGNGDGTFRPQEQFVAGSGAFAVAIADFDRNGRADVAVANNASNSVSLLLGNGNGILQTRRDFAVGLAPTSLGLGDYNTDGLVDIAVVNSFDGPGGNSVSLLMGAGDGTFRDPLDVETGRAPRAIDVADLNDDGTLDLATANRASGTVSVLLGNGDGTFKERRDFGVEFSPESLALGDVNGDGVHDIVVVRSAHLTSVLLGNGDGTFREPRHFATGFSPASVALHDFDGDGGTDIAVGNNGLVSILSNQAERCCPADFNGDTTPGDIFDLFDFLAALDSGLDFNGDTTPADIFDLFDFLAVLDAGCP